MLLSGLTSCLSYQTVYHVDGIYQLKRGDKIDIETANGEKSSGKVSRLDSSQLVLKSDTIKVADIEEVRQGGYVLYKRNIKPTGLLNVGDEVRVVKKNKIKYLGRLTKFDYEKVQVYDYNVHSDIPLTEIRSIEKDVTSPSRRKAHDIADIAVKVVLIIPVMVYMFFISVR